MIVHAEEEPFPALPSAQPVPSTSADDPGSVAAGWKAWRARDALTTSPHPSGSDPAGYEIPEPAGSYGPMASPDDPGWALGREYDDFAPVPVDALVGPDGDDVFVIYRTERYNKPDTKGS